MRLYQRVAGPPDVWRSSAAHWAAGSRGEAGTESAALPSGGCALNPPRSPENETNLSNKHTNPTPRNRLNVPYPFRQERNTWLPCVGNKGSVHGLLKDFLQWRCSERSGHVTATCLLSIIQPPSTNSNTLKILSLTSSVRTSRRHDQEAREAWQQRTYHHIKVTINE